MRFLAFRAGLLGLCVVLLSGCRTRYDITLNNGSVITAASKPRRQGNFYLFKDPSGRMTEVSAFRVVQIERRTGSGKARSPFIGVPE